jgi:DNA-binding MarR family transcriptional regulator
LANAKPDVGEATSFALEVPEETITQFIRVWRERNSYLPSELLLDPAWGMLLELLQAEIQDRSVSLARLCKVSGVSASSAVRWLKALEARELAVRRADPENANNEFVELSKKGSSTLRRYFHDILQSSRPFEDRC